MHIIIYFVKDLQGKELGKGIIQKKDGRYEARFTNTFGKRVSLSGSDLKKLKKDYNEAIYDDKKEINIKDNILIIVKELFTITFL